MAKKTIRKICLSSCAPYVKTGRGLDCECARKRLSEFPPLPPLLLKGSARKVHFCLLFCSRLIISMFFVFPKSKSTFLRGEGQSDGAAHAAMVTIFVEQLSSCWLQKLGLRVHCVRVYLGKSSLSQFFYKMRSWRVRNSERSQFSVS